MGAYTCCMGSHSLNKPDTTPDREFDPAALGALVRRFRHLHGERLARTAARLPERQRRVLEALPMLYHRNHPSLPGYAGPDVPAGIARFRPTRQHAEALQRIARGYREPATAGAQNDLQAIFIMGSGGTVGQSQGSDIDLWVCCDAMLHSVLWPKVRLLDQWAAELGLELHSFLVDPNVLRTRGRLPGTRTPGLLLDEFYRSAALVAGRYPLWWLIPDDAPEAYRATAARLQKRRFVGAESVIDFGPVPRFSADELAQAALNELDRARTTPHKSLLKLKLMEAYARAPQLGTVSAAYKARVHAGESDPLRLDPYLLMYDHVQRYLQVSGQDAQMDFVRGLLLGKAAGNAAGDGSAGGADERALLQRFLDWGFSREDVARFRTLETWSMGDRLTESGNVLAALDSGLDLAERLVEEAAVAPTQASAADDWRQLHWLNETRLKQVRQGVVKLTRREPGDVPRLHPALVSRRHLLPVQAYRDSDGWVAADAGRAVMRCPRLVALVLWAELNGAQLVPLRPDPTLTRNLAQILQGFRSPEQRVHVFANAESQDLPTGGAAASDLLRLRREPLRYVGPQRLPLDSFDIVSRSAAGRWHCEAVADLTAIERIGPVLGRPTEDVCWHVIGGDTRFATARRLEELHGRAERVLATPGALFALPLGTSTLTLRRLARAVEVRRHRSLAGLRDYVRASGCQVFGFDRTDTRLRSTLRAG